MGQVTGIVEFAGDTKASAPDVNSNFSKIVMEVNGGLDDSNVASDAAIVEAKLAFAGSDGHDHRKDSTKGTPIDVMSMVDAAVNNGAAGVVKFKSGTVTLEHPCLEGFSYEGEAFTQVPVLTVRRTTMGNADYRGTTNTRVYEGDKPAENTWGFYIFNETKDGFFIKFDAPGDDYTFAWQAVGI